MSVGTDHADSLGSVVAKAISRLAQGVWQSGSGSAATAARRSGNEQRHAGHIFAAVAQVSAAYDGAAGMDVNGLRFDPTADGCFRIKTEYPQFGQLLLAANDTHSHDEDQFPAAFVLNHIQCLLPFLSDAAQVGLGGVWWQYMSFEIEWYGIGSAYGLQERRWWRVEGRELGRDLDNLRYGDQVAIDDLEFRETAGTAAIDIQINVLALLELHATRIRTLLRMGAAIAGGKCIVELVADLVCIEMNR